jgi:MFS family permease
MPYRAISAAAKLLFACFLAGLALSALNVTLAQILRDFGLTPLSLGGALPSGVRWVVSIVLVGSLVAVPIWLTVRALRPRRRDDSAMRSKAVQKS